MRTLLIPLVLALGSVPLHAAPAARGKSAPRKPPPPTPEQAKADRHFRSGVALFKQAKYAEALAEFERAYEIAPHPLVLYNIAGCHRQLSHYSEAVSFYRRFLSEGKGVVPDERRAKAQTELDAILAVVARVTVTITPAADGATLSVDGIPIEHPEMPLILPPGEHRLTARVPGRPETERTVRVASGDELPLELVIATPAPSAPLATSPATEVVDHTPAAGAQAPPLRDPCRVRHQSAVRQGDRSALARRRGRGRLAARGRVRRRGDRVRADPVGPGPAPGRCAGASRRRRAALLAE